jgi:hypothetical protein
MKHLTLLVVSAAALCLFALACGGPSAGNSCGRVDPCGGDLVGSWSIVEACTDVDMALEFAASSALDAACGQAYPLIVHETSMSLSGAWSFNANMTYTDMRLVTVVVEGSPLSTCLATRSCAELDAALQTAALPNTDATIQSGRCVGESSCVCTIAVTDTYTATGTYAVSGSSISRSSDDGTSNSMMDYCVQGESAHFVLYPQQGGSAGSAVVAAKS